MGKQSLLSRCLTVLVANAPPQYVYLVFAIKQ